ncbi:MAG TPA: PstS family phosphate ABC transporter substrate-binding protein [Elainellaceae cyanobacterium]|jgi:phosphate transport system substrate-binding protein
MVLSGMRFKLNRLTLVGAAAVAVSGVGFSSSAASAQSIAIDGSSTVFPISEAMAEEYMSDNPGTQITVGVSGTGGGFEKFCNGETDISNASRPIKPTEMEACMANGIEYVEIPVAYDAITVVIHPENDWATEMTVEQLQTLWDPAAQGTITSWSDIEPSWPDSEISLYGPGTDSGTFDYFTDEIVGEEGASRADYTASEDDNILVLGVARDPNALGYFGYAYFDNNRDQLRAVAIDSGDGPVLPSSRSVNNGTYTPLSRPIFIYVSADSAQRAEVQSFVEYYLSNTAGIVPEVGYVALSEEAYSLGQSLLSDLSVGTVYQANETSGLDIEDVMQMSRSLTPTE